MRTRLYIVLVVAAALVATLIIRRSARPVDATGSAATRSETSPTVLPKSSWRSTSMHVAGTAKGADGAPCPGAVIALLSGDDREVAQAKTDQGGRFSFEDVQPGEYVVAGSSTTCGSGAADLFKVESGESKEDVAVLLRSARALLRGTVRDAGGGGVAALLSARGVQDAEGGPFRLAGVAAASPDGTFTLALAPGEYFVTAHATGFVDVRTRVVVLEPATTMTVLLQPSATLSGEVVSGDTAIAGATVRIVDDPAGRSVVTDEQGRFVLKDVAAGEHSVTARRGQLTGTTSVRIVFGVDAAITIPLQKGLSLAGRVRSEGRTTPPGTVLDLYAEGGLVEEAAPAADGAFMFSGLAAGTYSLTARAPEFAIVGRGPIDVSRNVDGVDLLLTDGASLTGTVRTARGLAVSRASLSLRLRCQDGASVERTEATDDSGQFHVANLCTGRAYVTVSHPTEGFASADVDVVAPDTKSDIALQATGRVSGTVKWSDGRPASVLVSLFARTSGRHTIVKASALGQFNFEGVAAGDVYVKGSTDGAFFMGTAQGSSEAALHVEPAQELKNVGLILAAQDGALNGVVTADAGPVGGALIRIRSGSSAFETYSLDDGTFAFSDIPRLAYTLSADAAGYAQTKLEALRADGTSVPVRLARGATMSVTTPFPPGIAVQVMVFRPGAPSVGPLRRQAGQGGAPILVADLPDGTYDVVATIPSGASAQAHRVVMRNGEDLSVSAGPVQASASIGGRVLDEAGKPIAGASVGLFSTDGLIFHQTDASGAFHFERVPVGMPMTGVIGAEGFRQLEKPIEASAPGANDVGTAVLQRS